MSALVFNAILASDRNNGIGIGNGLPWKLTKEFEHYMNTTHHKSKKDQHKKHVFICGPEVFKEYYCLAPKPDFIWAVVSQSITIKPENCDILTSDYSLRELAGELQSDQYRDNIGHLIVIGGVPLYNTVMDETFPYKSRFFWTRVDADFDVDRRVGQMNMKKWKEITGKNRDIEGFPALPEKTTELDNNTGKEISWNVHVYQNFATPVVGTDFRFGG